MNDWLAWAFFLCGLTIGSFLNVCVYHIPRDQSIISFVLRCTVCGTRKKGLDLVPVFSWLWLRGRCRYCQEGVPVRYPLIELLSGCVYAGVYLGYGLQPFVPSVLVLVSVLIVAAAIDLEHYRIPNSVVLFGFITGLVFVLWTRELSLANALLGVLAGAGPLYLLAVLTEGMGGGDVKLAGMVGLYLGWQKVILALFLAASTAAVIGLALIALGRKRRQDPIPFGPFIALGTLHVLLAGILSP